VHEGKHGILDDLDDMDSLFGTGEEDESEADGHSGEHDHKRGNGHDEHAGPQKDRDGK